MAKGALLLCDGVVSEGGATELANRTHVETQGRQTKAVASPRLESFIATPTLPNPTSSRRTLPDDSKSVQPRLIYRSMHQEGPRNTIRLCTYALRIASCSCGDMRGGLEQQTRTAGVIEEAWTKRCTR